MNNRIIIIILSSIIIVQMIAGIFILKRESVHRPQFTPFGFMGDRMGKEMGKHHMKGNRLGRSFCEPEFMEGTLSLNQDQIDKINELNKKFDTEFSNYTALIQPERKKLKDMLDESRLDINAVKKQLQKIENYNIEIHLLRIRQGKEISEILSPQQMKKLHNERKMFFENMQRNPGGMR